MRQGQGGGGGAKLGLGEEERARRGGRRKEEGGRRSVEVCVFLAGQGRKGKAYLPNMPCLCSSCGRWKVESGKWKVESRRKG